MKNLIPLGIATAVAGISGCGSPKSKEAGSSLPNIIYILADDMGYGDVSANYPDGKTSTPNIDRLASQGMRFTDAHSPSSVSTPTRYGIMTGRYCWRSRLQTGVLRGYGRSLPDKDRPTVASLLQERGYRTGIVGKWHLGVDWAIKPGYEAQASDDMRAMTASAGFVTDINPEMIDFTKPPENGPTKFGFDESYILPASLDMEPYCYLRNDTLTAPVNRRTEGNDLNTGYTGAFWRAGFMAENFDFPGVLPEFTNEAVRFVREKSKGDQPFFLYFPMTAPHTPWLPVGEIAGKSGAGDYGDFVAMVDAMVGKVMEAVAQAGIEENTVIIFASDNGPYWRPAMIEKYGHRAAGPFRGMKADIWDGGHRIPFIVRWPGKVKAGSVSDALTSLTNLIATAADIAGIDPQKVTAEDSYSILPVLLGRSQDVPSQPAVVHHSSRGLFAVRAGRWKLIEGRGSGGFSTTPAEEAEMTEQGQLYDMLADPGETNNLYATEKDKVKELSALSESIKAGNRTLPAGGR